MFKIPGIDQLFNLNKMKENKDSMGYKETIGDHNEVNDGPFKPFVKPTNYAKVDFLNRIVKNNESLEKPLRTVGSDNNYKAQDDNSQKMK
tara:strand:- start:264 stop:533 length:270 start_codon:yes stop_codon:yes gene_type:complete